jgi:hypothetical protein
MREYEEYLGTLTDQDVGCLTPGAGETPRGLMLRIRRAGTRLNRPVTAWIVDGAVYFSLEPPSRNRRARALAADPQS